MYQKSFFTIFTFLFIFVYPVKCQINGTCITPNKETAKCISVYDCKIYIDILKTRSESQKQYMKESLCGFFGKTPIVCCGSDTDYIKPPKRVRRDVDLKRNPLIPDTDCGKTVVDSFEYPWNVRLAYNKSSNFACEGTLINKRYVLTAATCIQPKTFERAGNIVKVRLGEHNCSPNDSECRNSIMDVGVEEIILHKNYGVDSRGGHDDIGLIRLDKDIIFNDAVAPICLPKPNEVAKAGDSVVEVGWYRLSPVKLKAVITVVSHETCSNLYEKHNVKLTASQMCAGGYPNGACAGLSGGALMSLRKPEASWILEGIGSFGSLPCGRRDFPNVFTKVESYLQWIHDSIKN